MSELHNLLDLRGKVALVTGAGRGVGATTAHFLAGLGASVAVNDFYADRAESVVEDIRSQGGTALAVPADITDLDQVFTMVNAITTELGAPDILVNNAGNSGATAQFPHVFWESAPEQWEPYLSINLNAVLNCTRAVVPGMIQGGYGRVITVISDAGRVGEANMEIYAAGKAGAAGFMRALARSVGRYGITANCVALGFTNTPATDVVLEHEEIVKKALSHYIIRRVGEPTDAAAMISFLSSPAASWITAQTYPVNGGYSVTQ